jgi:hypothetical protein
MKTETESRKLKKILNKEFPKEVFKVKSVGGQTMACLAVHCDEKITKQVMSFVKQFNQDIVFFSLF